MFACSWYIRFAPGHASAKRGLVETFCMNKTSLWKINTQNKQNIQSIIYYVNQAHKLK